MKKTKHRGPRTIFSSTLILVLVLTIVYMTSFLLLMRHTSNLHSTEQRNSQIERLQMALKQTENDLQSLAFWQRKILQARELQKVTYMYNDLDWYNRFSLQTALHNELVELKDHNSFVRNVWLYIPEIDKTISSARTYAFQESWFHSLPEHGQGLFRNADGQIVFLVSDLIMADIEHHPACVIVELDTDAFASRVQVSAGQSDEEIRLQWLVEEDQISEKDTVTVYGSIYPIALTLFQDKSEDTYVSDITRLAMLFLATSSLIMIIGLMVWRNRVYVPLQKLLTEAFEKTRQGDYHYRIPYLSSSPFAMVFDSYNQMMEKMEYYVENDLKQQILVSKANLKQLQSQINPHFMYNSYYILYRLIKRKDETNALKLAEYLGRFFQYVTRNADDEKKLSDEIDHARTYAMIQQFRFRDAVNIQIDDVPESIASVYVPRLILQPLLENAFNYVYEVTEGQTMVLRISYDIQSAQHFDIIVENGGTISDETIEGIRQRLQNTSDQIETTALINIHRRLQIYFGKDSGILVDRSKLGGLRVRVHILDTGEENRQLPGGTVE